MNNKIETLKKNLKTAKDNKFANEIIFPQNKRQEKENLRLETAVIKAEYELNTATLLEKEL